MKNETVLFSHFYKKLRSGKFTIMEMYGIIKSLVENSSLIAHKERNLFDMPKEKGGRYKDEYR